MGHERGHPSGTTKLASARTDTSDSAGFLTEGRSHVFHILTVFSTERDRLQRFLTEQGIQTLVHYPIPPHRQEALDRYAALSLPITEQIHREELSLPMSPLLETDEITQVINAVNAFV